MKKTLTCLLAAATIAAASVATRRMPPPSGGDGVAVGTEGDGGVADGDQELRQGSSAGP